MKELLQKMTTKQKISIGGILLALLGLIGWFTTMQPATSKSVALTTTKQPEQKVEVASKNEATFKLTDKTKIEDVVKETGIKEDVIVKATGQTEKSAVKFPNNGEIVVISNVSAKESDNKPTAEIRTKEASGDIKVTTIPVAKAVEGQSQPKGNQTIVVVRNDKGEPVAAAIPVSSKTVNGKVEFTEVVPTQPRQLTEDAVKAEVKAEVKTEAAVVNQIKVEQPTATIVRTDRKEEQPVIQTRQETERVTTQQETTVAQPETRPIVNRPTVVETKAPETEAPETWTYSPETVTVTKTETVYEDVPLYDDFIVGHIRNVQTGEILDQVDIGWYDEPGLEDKEVNIMLHLHDRNPHLHDRLRKGELVAGANFVDRVRTTEKRATGTKQVPVTETKDRWVSSKGRVTYTKP